MGPPPRTHKALYCRLLLPRIRRANARSVFISVTRFAWIVHRYLWQAHERPTD